MRSLYIFLGRFIATVGYPVFLAYFRLFPTRRVRVLVVDDEEKIILLRGWLGFQKWTLPGGGCKRGESDKEAASRELYEETGIAIAPHFFQPLKEYKDPDLGHTVPLLMAKIANTPLSSLKGPAALEIIERNWWSQGELPERRSPLIDRALAHLRPGVK